MSARSWNRPDPAFRTGLARVGGSHPPCRSRQPRRGGRWRSSRSGPMGRFRRGGSGAAWWPAPSRGTAASNPPRRAREAIAFLATARLRDAPPSVGAGLSASSSSGESGSGPSTVRVGATPGSNAPSPAARSASRANHHRISSMSHVMTAARLASSAGIGGKSAGSWVMAPVQWLVATLTNTPQAKCKGYFPHATVCVAAWAKKAQILPPSREGLGGGGRGTKGTPIRAVLECLHQ